MFWALNGATRTPRRASSRHKPVTSVVLPASLAVPHTIRPPRTMEAVIPGPRIRPGRMPAGPARRSRARRCAPCRACRSWRSPAPGWRGRPGLTEVGAVDEHPVGLGRPGLVARPPGGGPPARSRRRATSGAQAGRSTGVQEFGEGGGGQSVERPARLACRQAPGEAVRGAERRSRRAVRGRPAAWSANRARPPPLRRRRVSRSPWPAARTPRPRPPRCPPGRASRPVGLCGFDRHLPRRRIQVGQVSPVEGEVRLVHPTRPQLGGEQRNGLGAAVGQQQPAGFDVHGARPGLLSPLRGRDSGPGRRGAGRRPASGRAPPG